MESPVRLLYILFLVILRFSFVDTVCDFPTSWVLDSDSGWYKEGTLQGSSVINKFYIYNSTEPTLQERTSTDVVTDLQCDSGSASGTKYTYLTQGKCISNVAATNTHIFKSKTKAASETIATCDTSLETTNGFPLVKVPNTASGVLGYSTEPFPLAEGIYEATYTYDAGEMCGPEAQAGNSTVTVAGDTMTVSVCGTPTKDYTTPFNGDIWSIGSFEGSAVDQDSNGKVLVLAVDVTGTNRFFCARLGPVVSGQPIQLSIEVSNELKPTCTHGNRYDTFGSQAVRLDLVGPKVPTTVVPTTAAPTTVQDASTAPLETTAALTTGAAATGVTAGAATTGVTDGATATGVTDGATVIITTATSDITTIAPTTATPATFAAHVTLRFTDKYDERVGAEGDAFMAQLKAQLAALLGIDEDRIQPVSVKKAQDGGIIADFEILPDLGGTSPSDAVAILDSGIANNNVTLLDHNNQTLHFKPQNPLTVYYVPPEGACASSPCQNNGTCTNATLTVFTCACPDKFIGPTCSIKKKTNTDKIALIAVVCVVAAIFIILICIAIFFISRERNDDKAAEAGYIQRGSSDRRPFQSDRAHSQATRYNPHQYMSEHSVATPVSAMGHSSNAIFVPGDKRSSLASSRYNPHYNQAGHLVY